MDAKPDISPETELRIQQLMAHILAVRFSDPDQDQAACNELIELAQTVDHPYALAFAYAYLGDCLIGKNESISASTNLMRAMDLCEKYRFLDLLPYVCNWLGIYYEMQDDRQMAMHYYLDALEFAERSGDLLRQSILLNNIASQFQSCANYVVAKEYYLKALRVYHELAQPSPSNPHYAQMTANIISVCCRLKQTDEAMVYFNLLNQSGQLAKNQNQLYLCQLMISFAVEDVQAARTSVDHLLLELQQRLTDHHQFFETFLVVAEGMISLNEPEYARKILCVLNSMCPENEYGHRLKVQYIWMRFYKTYGTAEEKADAYILFYELRQLSDEILKRNLADGLLSKIKLRESVKKTEEMEREREQLEDEMQLDELTQLYNRRSLRQLTERVATDQQVHTLALMMIDVDYFKQYNDTYGHTMGDEALQEVANSLLAASCDDVYSFRYGGDEFVSMCTNKTIQEVELYIQTFSEILRSKQIAHSSSLCSQQMTLSVGCCFRSRYGAARLDTAEMMEQADRALYTAKDRGRNIYCLAPTESEHS